MSASPDGITRYSDKNLRAWVSSVFQAAGIRAGDADETARILVRTNLRGIDTHGVARVPAYLEKVRSGEVNAQPTFKQEFRDEMLLFDGDGGLGQSVVSEAVRLCTQRAQSTAVVTALVRGSGHLAAIGLFVLEAAERGMVAMICQETPPLMALAGSRRASIGNNPIAFAAPVAEGPPLIFDMATSVVARGNVLQAIRDGQTQIPAEWAIGPDGQPTTDPRVALEGAMQPIAGHKGVGLAMLVQVLAGSLSGSATAASAAAHSAKSNAGNVSAFLLIINPERLVRRAEFDAHMSAWIKTYLNASGSNGRYPGQRAAECEMDRAAHGIPIATSILTELMGVGKMVGQPFNLPPFK